MFDFLVDYFDKRGISYELRVTPEMFQTCSMDFIKMVHAKTGKMKNELCTVVNCTQYKGEEGLRYL